MVNKYPLILDHTHHKKIKKYAIMEHSNNSKQHIFLADSKVLTKIMHYYKRKIRLALEIKIFGNNVNQGDGFKLFKNLGILLYITKNQLEAFSRTCTFIIQDDITN